MEPVHPLLEDLSTHETQNHPPPYRYNSLPQDGHFRYLVLQPGVGDESLQCNLHIASLSEEDFEAISYVWGNPTRDQEIICDGHTMKITQNLSEVLRRVRLPEIPRRLWADSICINQDDLEEKGHQVAIMGQIYSAAKRVVIYVGSDKEEHGPRLCSLLDDVNTMIDDICKRIDMSWDSFPYPGEDDLIPVDARWESMYHLLGENWFNRGWVVREVAVAQDGQVIWGQSDFTWRHFMHAYVWLVRRATRLYYAAKIQTNSNNLHLNTFENRHKSFAQAFPSETTWIPQSLLDDLDSAKELQLSDPRDRLYAFMELSQDSRHPITIRPDYDASHLEIYQQFAVQYIQSSTSTEILDYVTYEAGTTDFDVPSWVPHWDVRRYSIVSQISSSEAAPLSSRDESVCEPLVISDATLKVRGVVLDTVVYTSDVFDYDLMTSGTISKLWKAVRTMTEESQSPYSAFQRIDAVLNTLSCGRRRGGWFQWRQARAAFVRETQLRNDVVDRPQRPDLPATARGGDSIVYFNIMKEFLSVRRFTFTSRGYMGLAPAITEVGDTCGIVFGCKFPCILRRTNQGQSYKFLRSIFLRGKQAYEAGGGIFFTDILGHENSKDWVEWDVEEQDIDLVGGLHRLHSFPLELAIADPGGIRVFSDGHRPFVQVLWQILSVWEGIS
jgi:hypothetical protein